MSDRYYEPSDAAVSDDDWEDANQDLDNLVAEWATLGEVEVHVQITLDHDDIEYGLDRIARDGAPVYQPVRTEWFSSLEGLRTKLEEVAPLPAYH